MPSLTNFPGEYKILYMQEGNETEIEEAVYVLHCFQKKTVATSKHDKDIAEARYRAVVRERKAKK